MTGDGRFVEVQATAEKDAFSAEQYAALVGLAGRGHADVVRPPARGAGAGPALKVVARRSRNRGKLREIVPLLAGLRLRRSATIDEVAPDCELREDGDTFEANALAKARQAARGDRLAGHRRRLRAGGRRAGRRARRLLGALRRAARPTTRATTPSCWRRCAACRRRAARRGFAASPPSSTPARGVELDVQRRLRGRDPRAAARRAWGSATIPLFLVPALGANDGGAAARREEPAVAPRRRLPGAGDSRAAQVAQRAAGQDRVEDQRHRADEHARRGRCRRAHAAAAVASRCEGACRRPSRAACATPPCSRCPTSTPPARCQTQRSSRFVRPKDDSAPGSYGTDLNSQRSCSPGDFWLPGPSVSVLTPRRGARQRFELTG